MWTESYRSPPNLEKLTGTLLYQLKARNHPRWTNQPEAQMEGNVMIRPCGQGLSGHEPLDHNDPLLVLQSIMLCFRPGQGNLAHTTHALCAPQSSILN